MLFELPGQGLSRASRHGKWGFRGKINSPKYQEKLWPASKRKRETNKTKSSLNSDSGGQTQRTASWQREDPVLESGDAGKKKGSFSSTEE